jgi:hypothetical protein
MAIGMSLAEGQAQEGDNTRNLWQLLGFLHLVLLAAFICCGWMAWWRHPDFLMRFVGWSADIMVFECVLVSTSAMCAIRSKSLGVVLFKFIPPTIVLQLITGFSAYCWLNAAVAAVTGE